MGLLNPVTEASLKLWRPYSGKTAVLQVHTTDVHS